MTYEEYVEERLFGALGMDDSHYCSETEIHPGKVNGYEVGPDGLRHKGFIVHNVPYAAGSLCSSAADMATWLTALHSGEVLNDDGYDQLITPGDLNDGLRFGTASASVSRPSWGTGPSITGGGIPGFLTQTLYLPEEELSVAVLLNTAGPPGPDSLAATIVDIMVGDATPEASTYDGDLSALTGTYRGPARGGTLGIRIDAEEWDADDDHRHARRAADPRGSPGIHTPRVPGGAHVPLGGRPLHVRAGSGRSRRAAMGTWEAGIPSCSGVPEPGVGGTSQARSTGLMPGVHWRSLEAPPTPPGPGGGQRRMS